MPLVSGIDLLKHAHEHNYAVGAFNYANMENLQAIIQAAEELNSPVIIQITEKSIAYAGFDYLVALGLTAAKQAKVPVMLHLDHGQQWDVIMCCLQAGFSSVMVDASRHSFEDNVTQTKKVVEAAKPLKIAVESELGFIGGKEGDAEPDEDIYTDITQATEFAMQTQTNSLAIAVGTQHGLYKGEINIDFARIRAIKEQTQIALVLHGSSGVPDEMVTQAVAAGINKVNFDTEVKLASRQALTSYLETHPDVYDIRKIYHPAREAMAEKIKEKIRLLGSEQKSWL